MSVKQEKTRPSGGIKILNDERISPLPLPLPVMTSVPAVDMSPTKRVSLSIAKVKIPTTKQKKMDHYMLQTIKGEKSTEGADGDNIAFVLTNNDEESEKNSELVRPSGEITEELHLSGDDDEEGEEKTEQIVEHVCGKCFKSFRRLNGLRKHLDFCRFDSGYHLRKAEMQKNLDKIEKDGVVMENKDICFCCGESYDTCHLGHINCPDCPKSFKSQMSYERHIFITHSEFDDNPCVICNAKLRSDKLLKLHMDQHKNRGKPYACKICGKDFTRSYHLKRHQKYSSCSANEGDAMTCKVCNRSFYRLDNLRAHLKQHLGTTVTKKPEYMCSICKNCFYSLSTLNIHTRTHTGERPFDCDLCDKKFPSLVALKKHRRYHTGEKPYTCSVCSQSFAVKEVLNRHMKRHTGERPHVCKECGKSFIQATQLRNHAKTHNKPFECTDCNEKFKTERQLERHSATHSPRRRKKLKCIKCKISFNKQEELDLHNEEGIHEQKVKRKRARTDCSICEKNFNSVKNLQFHILKVHEVDPELFVEENASPPSKIIKLEKPNNSGIEISGNTSLTTATSSTDITAANTVDDTNAENATQGGVVVQEFIIDDVPTSSDKQTIILENEAFTVIPLDSDGIIETVTTNKMPEQVSPEPPVAMKKERKSLAESLAAAIADNDEEEELENDVQSVHDALSEEDLKIKENVGKLLDMLVDSITLKKFGWPQTSEEVVLCKVIENCGHDLSKDEENYKECDYATRIREYVKLLFTVVIHNDSIKELLNNYSIDEVIEYVLGNDDDEDDDNEEEHNEDGDEVIIP